MDISKILSTVDHTLLLQNATMQQIELLCDEAIEYKTASVCIPPSFVGYAKKYCSNKIAICTVIGFPNGYNNSNVKLYEAQDALSNGADELDMVINIGALKDGNFSFILNEIKQLKAVCKDNILKVIIETCLLTDGEKVKMCEIVTEAGADFIKTSTGFSHNGAIFGDIELFTKHIGNNVSIKAAGGISSIEDAERFISLGCKRLGTSRIIKILKAENNNIAGY